MHCKSRPLLTNLVHYPTWRYQIHDPKKREQANRQHLHKHRTTGEIWHHLPTKPKTSRCKGGDPDAALPATQRHHTDGYRWLFRQHG